MPILHSVTLSNKQKMLIRLCMTPTILSAGMLLISYLKARTVSPALAFWEYSAMLESIFAALAITVCGVALLRCVELETQR